MNWVVTSDAGTTMLAEQFGPAPSRTPDPRTCSSHEEANEYVASSNYTVTWAFNWTPLLTIGVPLWSTLWASIPPTAAAGTPSRLLSWKAGPPSTPTSTKSCVSD